MSTEKESNLLLALTNQKLILELLLIKDNITKQILNIVEKNQALLAELADASDLKSDEDKTPREGSNPLEGKQCGTCGWLKEQCHCS